MSVPGRKKMDGNKIGTKLTVIQMFPTLTGAFFLGGGSFSYNFDVIWVIVVLLLTK